jgi:hypothetical protein
VQDEGHPERGESADGDAAATGDGVNGLSLVGSDLLESHIGRISDDRVKRRPRLFAEKIPHAHRAAHTLGQRPAPGCASGFPVQLAANERDRPTRGGPIKIGGVPSRLDEELRLAAGGFQDPFITPADRPPRNVPRYFRRSEEGAARLARRCRVDSRIERRSEGHGASPPSVRSFHFKVF